MSIALVGILSGMIFGTLAVLLRRFIGAIILAPVVIAPLAYLFVWRDALIGHCFFASNFNTQGCTAFRSFLGMSLDNAGSAILVLSTHLVFAFVTFLAVSMIRKAIANADMSTPAQKEMQRQAEERMREAQAELKAKMEEELKAATLALEASRRPQATS